LRQEQIRLSFVQQEMPGNAMIDRRDALKLALGSAAALAASAARAQSPAKPRTKIVFLGTKGGPRVDVGPSNPANLVVVNDTPFVIDCGMGVSRQLASAGVPLASVMSSSAITTPIIILNTATSSTTHGRPAFPPRSTHLARRASRR
jgi:hypothetical protein